MKQIQNDLIKIQGKIDAHLELHNRNMEIMNLNLEDLNVRWNNSIEIVYVTEKIKFEPSDYTDPANYNVVDLLNKYVKWDLSQGKDRKFQIKTYLRSVKSKFEELNTELHYRKLTNGLNNNDIANVNAFVINYQSFSPKGILSEIEENELKSTFNKYCETLKSNFLSEKDVELNLGDEESVRENTVKQSSELLLSVNQILANYLKIKSNETSLWSRLIGQ